MPPRLVTHVHFPSPTNPPSTTLVRRSKTATLRGATRRLTRRPTARMGTARKRVPLLASCFTHPPTAPARARMQTFLSSPEFHSRGPAATRTRPGSHRYLIRGQQRAPTTRLSAATRTALRSRAAAFATRAVRSVNSQHHQTLASTTMYACKGSQIGGHLTRVLTALSTAILIPRTWPAARNLVGSVCSTHNASASRRRTTRTLAVVFAAVSVLGGACLDA